MTHPEQTSVENGDVMRTTLSGKEPTFEVTYGCANCGAAFERQYGAGTNVSNKNDGVYVGACSTMGCQDCCGRVQCPTCELHKGVGVDDRTPIMDAGGEDS